MWRIALSHPLPVRVEEVSRASQVWRWRSHYVASSCLIKTDSDYSRPRPVRDSSFLFQNLGLLSSQSVSESPFRWILRRFCRRPPAAVVFFLVKHWNGVSDRVGGRANVCNVAALQRSNTCTHSPEKVGAEV